MNDRIIEIKNLSKSFGETKAVRGIDLNVRKGEMFGMVGPDGAGKTTTIRMLCGIIPPDSGTGTIFGYDFRKDTEKIKDHIGYLSQKFSLYQDLTIDENIEFFADIHKVKNYKKRRNELLEFTRLTDFRKRLAGKLSGGMKQKLALACTLIHTPEIIFLDEPTTGVDPVSRRDFWKILFNLLKNGITIILTTPYLDEAERCTHIGMMHEGVFLVVDTFTNIQGLMKGTLLEIVCSNIRQSFKLLSNLDCITEVQAFGDRLNAIVCKKSDENTITRVLTSNGIVITDIRAISPSLENVFITLIEKQAEEEDANE